MNLGGISVDDYFVERRGDFFKVDLLGSKFEDYIVKLLVWLREKMWRKMFCSDDMRFLV